MRYFLIIFLVCFFSLNAYALEIKSTVFENESYISQKHTCDAEDYSPALSWTGISPEVKSYTLICDDPDAPSKVWVHWVLFNIPVDTASLPENVSPAILKAMGAVQGKTDFGKIGYGGPCPPPGKAHRYFFKLYALDKVLSLKEGATKKEVEQAMEGHIIEEAQIIGFYKR